MGINNMPGSSGLLYGRGMNGFGGVSLPSGAKVERWRGRRGRHGLMLF